MTKNDHITEWHKKYYKKIINKLSFRLRPEDAEDVFQNIVIRMLSEKRPYEELSQSKQTTWAYYDFKEKQRVLENGDMKSLMGREDDFLVIEDNPEAMVIKSEELYLFQKYLMEEVENIPDNKGSFPELEKEVFINVFFNDIDKKDIAEKLNFKYNYVRMAYVRAYNRVFDNLKQKMLQKG